MHTTQGATAKGTVTYDNEHMALHTKYLLVDLYSPSDSMSLTTASHASVRKEEKEEKIMKIIRL